MKKKLENKFCPLIRDLCKTNYCSMWYGTASKGNCIIITGLYHLTEYYLKKERNKNVRSSNGRS